MMTEVQSQVGAVLEELGFELEPSNVMGGPAKYEITQEVIDTLKKKIGSFVVVGSDATTSFEPPTKPR